MLSLLQTQVFEGLGQCGTPAVHWLALAVSGLLPWQVANVSQLERQASIGNEGMAAGRLGQPWGQRSGVGEAGA